MDILVISKQYSIIKQTLHSIFLLSTFAMALQLSLSSFIPTSCSTSLSSNQQTCLSLNQTIGPVRKVRIRSTTAVRSSLDMAGPTVGRVTDVNKDTFWPIVKEAGSKVVVLDMYTQWCGPCKIIAPKYKELSEKHLDIVFLKLDCNVENKDLAKTLGIKVVPTFKILKDGEVVKEVRGAKIDELVLAIESVKN